MNVFSNTKVWQKLIFVVLLVAIPLVVSVYLLVSNQNESIAISQKEIHGVEFVLPVQHMAGSIAKHRGISSAVLNGGDELKSQLAPVVNSIENNIVEIDKLNELYGVELKTTDKWAVIKQKWNALKLSYQNMDVKQNFSAHSDVINDVLALSTHIGDTSSLILDPDLDSFYLMDLIINKLPFLAEEIGKARGAGVVEAARGHMTNKELLYMAKEVEKIEGLYRNTLVSIATAFQSNSTLKSKLGSYENQFIQGVSGFLDVTNKEFLYGGTTISVSPDKYFTSGTQAIMAVQALGDATGPALNELLQVRVNSLVSSRNWEIGLVLMFVVIAFIIGYWVIKNLVAGMSVAVSVANAIANDELDSEIVVKSNDETGQLLSAFKDMQTKLKTRIDTDRKEAAENGRVKQALDAVTTNVMVADENNDIVYMNDALIEMFEIAADDIRKDLPRFNEKNLMGGNMDQFHKDPSHQRKMISGLKESISAKILVGGRTFSLVATPVVDDTGTRLGTAVEWKDRTEELKVIENEKRLMNEAMRVQSALAAVTSNVMVADAENNIIFMNEALKEMFDIAQNDIRKDLPNFDRTKLQGGNMDQFHKNPAHQQRMIDGLKETIKSQIEVGGRTFTLVATPVFNDEGDRLGTAVEWNDRTAELQIEQEVEDVVTAAANGDLGKRLTMDGKKGFFRNVSEGINQLAEVCDDVIKDTIRVFGAMADGDLTEKITKEYQGSFEQLKADANATIDKFVEVVDEIQNTSASVNTGASEISTGNQSLSQRNEEQASSLEETASSMEEMTGTVRQNADNANKANQLAAAARNQAEKGGEVVGSAVNAMSEINTSSKKVADIISVIDEIAFQTNLLALNAAVEAARAGEQGRGFAVVASEVRNLAQRSAGAAKEIKDLIEESVNKVDEGTELVNASGETLEEIVNGIKKVSDIVAEIAAASAEQASGIDQVNKAVTQLDDMTQQNAALVEEAAAASEAMQGQAEGLSELMTFFSTGKQSSVSEVKTRPRVEVTKRESHSASSAVAGGESKPKAIPDDEEWEEF